MSNAKRGRDSDIVNGPACEYVSTAKGQNALVYEGFMYGTNTGRSKHGPGKRCYWRCMYGCKNLQIRCRASAVTLDDKIVKISPKEFHRHQPEFEKIEAKRVLDQMKIRAATEETPVEQIYQDIVAAAAISDEVAIHVPNVELVAKRLKRVRRKVRSTVDRNGGIDNDPNWILPQSVPYGDAVSSQNHSDSFEPHYHANVDEMNFDQNETQPIPLPSKRVVRRNNNYVPTRTIQRFSGSPTGRSFSSANYSPVVRTSNYTVVNMTPWRKINSLVAATLTPMHSDGSVNVELIPRYVDVLLNNGIRYVFINGTAGESMSLTVSERKLLAEKWIAAARGKLDGVIVHVGASNLRESQELAVHAENYGCMAIAAMVPSFFKPKTVGCLVNYCADLAKSASRTPFIYYHFPAMNGVDINVTEFLSEAVNHISTLIGVKFTSSDLADATQAHLLFDKKFEVFYGGETAMLGALSMGINSFIGGSFSLTGRPCKRLIEAFNAGDWDQSRDDQYKIQQFFKATHKSGDFQAMITAFKAVLTCSGVDVGPPRSPIQSLNRDELSVVEKNLEFMSYNAWVQ